jgi:hypothetical protein
VISERGKPNGDDNTFSGPRISREPIRFRL